MTFISGISGIMNFISIIRTYWKALAIALLITICYLRIAYIKSERDEAIANLKTTTELIRDNAIKAETKNALLAEQGAQQRKEDKEQSIKNAQIIGNAYYSMFKDAKDEAKKVKINSDAAANKLRDELRQQSAIIASRGMSKDDAIYSSKINGDAALSGRAGEESAEFYRTALIGAMKDLRACKLSGASCASDFNECSKYSTGEQKRIGVYAE